MTDKSKAGMQCRDVPDIYFVAYIREVAKALFGEPVICSEDFTMFGLWGSVDARLAYLPRGSPSPAMHERI
jgi:hypothetical protein